MTETRGGKHPPTHPHNTNKPKTHRGGASPSRKGHKPSRGCTRAGPGRTLCPTPVGFGGWVLGGWVWGVRVSQSEPTGGGATARPIERRGVVGRRRISRSPLLGLGGLDRPIDRPTITHTPTSGQHTHPFHTPNNDSPAAWWAARQRTGAGPVRHPSQANARGS